MPFVLAWQCVFSFFLLAEEGVHLEGPFISKEKRGAHPEHCLRTFEEGAFQDLLDTYGCLDCVRIVTLAPEMKRSSEVIRELARRGICVSLGKWVPLRGCNLGVEGEAGGMSF